MTKIVKYDLRTVNTTRREITIVEFNSKDIPIKRGKIPEYIVEHWKKDKSPKPFEYASFRGLTPEDCKLIYGFSKGGSIEYGRAPITLGVTRMGNIVSFKICLNFYNEENSK